MIDWPGEQAQSRDSRGDRLAFKPLPPRPDSHAGRDHRSANRLTIHTETPSDRPKRHALAIQPDRLRLLVDVKPKAATRSVSTTEVSSHGCSVDAVSVGKLQNPDAGLIVSDQAVDLGGSEKSLNRLDFADHRPSTVPDRAVRSAPGLPVDSPVPALD